MPTGTTGAPLTNPDGGTLTDPITGAALVDTGDSVFGHPIPRTADAGAALTNLAGGGLLDPITGAQLISEGLGILAGRTTKYLTAAFDTVPAQDFTIHSGDCAQIVVTLADVDGSPFNAQQATITWTAGKIGITSAIAKSSENAAQIRKPNKAHNIVIIHLTADDTALSAGSDLGVFYQHTLKITTTDLLVITAMTGMMTLIRSL